MAEQPISIQDKIAVEKRNRMSEIETRYLRAAEYHKSPQFLSDRLDALEKVRSIVRLGPVTEAEALLMVGRLQQLLLDTFAHENIIIEYEGLRKELKEMFGEK